MESACSWGVRASTTPSGASWYILSEARRIHTKANVSIAASTVTGGQCVRIRTRMKQDLDRKTSIIVSTVNMHILYLWYCSMEYSTVPPAHQYKSTSEGVNSCSHVLVCPMFNAFLLVPPISSSRGSRRHTIPSLDSIP